MNQSFLDRNFVCRVHADPVTKRRLCLGGGGPSETAGADRLLAANPLKSVPGDRPWPAQMVAA